MITNFLQATLGIFNFIWTKKVGQPVIDSESFSEKTESIKIENTVTEFANVDSAPKDKILFQPNVLAVRNSLNFPSNKNPALNNQQRNEEQPKNEAPKHSYKVTLELEDAAMSHLQSLCRFFEINQFDAIAKGVWLLTIARDIEINNKKLGIISLDTNGLVIDVMPVNIV